MGVTVVSWNIARSLKPWRELVQMDADVALLQESVSPPGDLLDQRDATLGAGENSVRPDIGPRESWDSHSWNSDWWDGRDWPALYDRWPMVVRLSDRVRVDWFKQVGPSPWTGKTRSLSAALGRLRRRVSPQGTAQLSRS